MRRRLLAGRLGTGLLCFACPADCKTCSDDATCESCFDGYYHDMDRCVPCFKNCKQCNYNGYIQCESGYELNNGKCSTCKDGYSLTAEGQCVKTTMPEHCKTYDGTKCTECETGYGLDSNNKCEKYPDLGCETYQWTADGFECASCSGTQKLAYNICKDGLRAVSYTHLTLPTIA